MTSSFLDGTGKGRRAAVILIAAASVLALAAAIAALVLFNRDNANTDSSTPRPNATANVPTGPLTQIKGQSTVDGVSVGYPHTTAGAVSAAAEYSAKLGSTLDLDRMRRLAPVVADPSYANAEQKLVEGRISSRKRLGLPETGPVPAGASMTVGPAAFQLRAVTEDSMTVLLLSYLTTVDSNGTIASRAIVQPVEMHWANGDWKLLPPGPASEADYSALATQPGTADAAAKGWQVLNP